jgi:hypothetical protein
MPAYNAAEENSAFCLLFIGGLSPRAFIPHFIADEMMMRSYATSQLRRIAAGA